MDIQHIATAAEQRLLKKGAHEPTVIVEFAGLPKPMQNRMITPVIAIASDGVRPLFSRLSTSGCQPGRPPVSSLI